jgi:hypothetical protein
VTAAHPPFRRLAACAGLIGGPMLWAVNTQLGPILPYAECSSRFYPSVAISVLMAGLTLVTGIISWRHPWDGQAGTFTSRLSAVLAVIFTFALLLQATAGLVLTGCER